MLVYKLLVRYQIFSTDLQKKSEKEITSTIIINLVYCKKCSGVLGGKARFCTNAVVFFLTF